MASVLITGTSKGIGMVTALVLGRAGHTVYATMRNPNSSPELAQTAAKEALPITVSRMDVDSDDSVREAIGAIHKEHGPVDVLVNNAGIECRGSIEEVDLSHFRAVMETNYFGALRCIQAVLPQMRARKSGCIISVTSVAGRISASPLGAYSASKFALEALSEALAQEAKMFNTRVAIVQPGIIDTAMARRTGDQPPASLYPHMRRMAGLFTASLHNPVSPLLVGQKILDIIDSGTWQLRHPVGPDAEPFLQWRAAMTDEQWVDWGATDDDTWYQNVERDFGLNARPRE
jgi:NAD(P)-dependent dehydrogenase (short-subunit alcohol dehydrogenase family)